MNTDATTQLRALIIREQTLIRRLEQASMLVHGPYDGRWQVDDHALLAAQRRLARVRSLLAALAAA